MARSQRQCQQTVFLLISADPLRQYDCSTAGPGRAGLGWQPHNRLLVVLRWCFQQCTAEYSQLRAPLSTACSTHVVWYESSTA